MRLTLLLLTWYQDERVVGDFVATPGRGHYRIHCLQISGRDTYLVRWHRSQQSSFRLRGDRSWRDAILGVLSLGRGISFPRCRSIFNAG
jgi:hypothetical protein